MIVSFEPWHLLAITPQPYQAGCIRTEQHAKNIAEVGAFTCLHDGIPVAAGGIVPAEKYGLVFSRGIGNAWMVIAEGITPYWPEIFRATRRELRRGLARYHRIEANTTFPEGERMLEMLGMQCEGHLKKYSNNGGDASLWAITR
ncbi:TPA: hypothetical protein MFX78_02385 [Klebsiella pneumoniae]|uniref:hypothetical protein n=1 Tax=Klebsiella pneumoniae TaxID=573 RepID=UPI001330471A|nr:hypothetical protein [Klebsiella pneumoniae]EIV9538810.1 hypothetical protein [Klebsiella pneumoniae]CAE7500503.1 hypothetical protein AI2675V1_3109 [Klebsiella pneumoniae]CAH3859417.1 hypothetical protein AI2675V1_3109 [Klebsiella pneumoniae]CAH5585647.1 hypothetical protein AI2942V1_1476 [Klebsiella pneumoniae]HBW9906973.1 hypothetical protein [Klebsiella pneumoniae]